MWGGAYCGGLPLSLFLLTYISCFVVQAQVRQLQEQLAIEKSVWQENYRKKHEAEMMARERELQQQVKQTRDAEIERVMQQLLKDNQQSIDECEREADKRIKYASTGSAVRPWLQLPFE